MRANSGFREPLRNSRAAAVFSGSLHRRTRGALETPGERILAWINLIDLVRANPPSPKEIEQVLAWKDQQTYRFVIALLE